MNNYPYYPQSFSQMPQTSFMPGRPTYMDALQQTPQNPQYLAMKGRPVASFDEAKASMIDFDGSVFYFPDPANQKIYTKQINLDGTSSLKTYALTENYLPPTSNQQSIPQPSNLVSKEEFQSTINSLTEEIQLLKGALNLNDESSTNDDVATHKF